MHTVQQSRLLRQHQAWFWQMQFWHLQCAECFRRKEIMWRVLQDIKARNLRASEKVARQRLMQQCACGLAGLKVLERKKAVAIEWTILVSWEGIRQQMTTSAYLRELGPVETAFNHLLGLNVHPLTRERDLTQPLNQARNQHPLNADPVPYEEYLQQCDYTVVGGQRRMRDGRQGDGRERGNRPKKRQKAGFAFRT